MFELCDDDDDGCMRPVEILFMFQRVERIFAKECSRIKMPSSTLINSIADKRAEINFHCIMEVIKEQTFKKKLYQIKKDQGLGKDGKNSN